MARIFDEGEGPALVVIPGLHGRWEWARPTLRALAASGCRTLSYSLAGDIGSGCRLDRARGFDCYLDQLDRVLDNAGIRRASLCGVSFGGFVAVRYAAERPERVSSLVLASAPGPGFKPSARQSRWLSRPWLSTPAFVLTSPARVWPEIRTPISGLRRQLSFAVRQTLRCAAAPMIPSQMAVRMQLASRVDFAAACSRISAPTLVVSGEERLDRVVPVGSTRAYASMIPNAEYRVIPETGHLGILTRPGLFADTVAGFVHAHHH